GNTNSHDFPTTIGRGLNLDSGLLDNDSDAFVVKLAVTVPTTTALTLSSTGNAVFGQSIKLTAIVATSPAGAGTPTSTVTFFDGTTTLGTATLDSNGQATLTVSTLALGTHSITAQYAGDSNFVASTSGATSATVIQASTATTLTVAPSTPVFGQV